LQQNKWSTLNDKVIATSRLALYAGDSAHLSNTIALGADAKATTSNTSILGANQKLVLARPILNIDYR
jgi:hypothetical protein